ncbi:hypothetical protein RHMOL_Rhmol11G0007200 [Rhododendron molle]|uniref:Uncharacterized protein n=1 Tax=Rhododendron molle TaxID=49168 RepID=A0ACC0LM65_RHOML|nr:hypothetical protein RHMOL_Rhmol11G0007200 [Rhododendron molle]
MMAIGYAIEVFVANTWTDSDEEPAKEELKRRLNQSKEKTDWQRSFNHESMDLLFKEFCQVALVEEAEEAEMQLLGPDII